MQIIYRNLLLKKALFCKKKTYAVAKKIASYNMQIIIY